MRTFQTDLIARDGAGWLATIRAIHLEELARQPSDFELATHMAWILEGREGGWDADRIRAFVRELAEWAVVHPGSFQGHKL